MKWLNVLFAAVLAGSLGACAQLDRVLDACMDGVVGPAGSGAMVERKLSESSWSSREPVSNGLSYRDSLPPLLRAGLGSN